jgi:hypothetical protein
LLWPTAVTHLIPGQSRRFGPTREVVEATGFAQLRRLRLVEALAFDGAFSGGLFAELRP